MGCAGPGDGLVCPENGPQELTLGVGDDMLCKACSVTRTRKIKKATLYNDLLRRITQQERRSISLNDHKDAILKSTMLAPLQVAKSALLKVATDFQVTHLPEMSAGRSKDNVLTDVMELLTRLRCAGVCLWCEPEADKPQPSRTSRTEPEPLETSEDPPSVGKADSTVQDNRLDPNIKLVVNLESKELDKHPTLSSYQRNVLREAQTQTTTTILNELLCYVQHELDRGTPEMLLAQLCSSFYKDTDIVEAKKLLFSQVDTGTRRFTQRRGDSKKRDNMDDIIRVFMEMNPQNTPDFVAKDLANLPPANHHNMDVLKLLQEIDIMKQSINLIAKSQEGVIALVKQGTTTERTVYEVHANPETLVQQVPHEGDLGSLHDIQNDVNIESSPEVDVEDSRFLQDESLVGSSEEPDEGPQPISQVKLDDEQQQLRSTREEQQPQQSSSEGTTQDHQQEGPQNANDTFTVVTRRRKSRAKANAVTSMDNNEQQPSGQPHITKRNGGLRNGAIIGTGEVTSIKTVPKRAGRSCTGLFVTNLVPTTHADQLVAFIKKGTGYDVRVEKISIKQNGNHSSFFIKASKHIRENLIKDASIWPKNAYVRKYYE